MLTYTVHMFVDTYVLICSIATCPNIPIPNLREKNYMIFTPIQFHILGRKHPPIQISSEIPMVN